MSKIEEIKENVWQINLKPFGKDESQENIDNFQEACINSKYLGVGWCIESRNKGLKQDRNKESFASIYAENFIDDNKSYFEEHKEEVDRVQKNIKNNLQSLLNMREGDYVFTRISTGNYYVGKISEEAEYYSGENKYLKNRLSYYCKVNEWKKVNPSDMASEVVGRFSQKYQKTVRRIGEGDGRRYRFIKYAKTILEEKVGADKIKLNKNNYVNCLNPDELEDLVGSYILNNNKGYTVIPSSCKSNTENIEYIMVNNQGETITLQVKNREVIDVRKYLKLAEDYKKIYLFSGVKCNYYKKSYKEKGLVIVGKEELWNHLKNNKNKGTTNYIINRIKKYYSLEDDVIHRNNCKKIKKELDKNGYSQRGEKSRTWKNKYSIWEEGETIFIGTWHCFYDCKLDTLVKYGDVDDELRYIFEKI